MSDFKKTRLKRGQTTLKHRKIRNDNEIVKEKKKKKNKWNTRFCVYKS